jgi:hypothetical protein
MSIGTAMIVIAFGVLCYKKPVVLKWTGAMVAVVLVLGIAAFVYNEHTKPKQLTAADLFPVCDLNKPVAGCVTNDPAPWEVASKKLGLPR